MLCPIPDCRKAIKNKAGVYGHLQIVHGKGREEAERLLKAQEAGHDETPSTGEEHMAAECMECKLKERDIKDKDKELDALRAQLGQLQGQVKSPPYPSVDQFVKHCEDGSCKEHSDAWNGVKASVVTQTIEKLPKDVVEKKALDMGLIPQHIILRQ